MARIGSAESFYGLWLFGAGAALGDAFEGELFDESIGVFSSAWFWAMAERRFGCFGVIVYAGWVDGVCGRVYGLVLCRQQVGTLFHYRYV